MALKSNLKNHCCWRLGHSSRMFSGQTTSFGWRVLPKKSAFRSSSKNSIQVLCKVQRSLELFTLVILRVNTQSLLFKFMVVYRGREGLSLHLLVLSLTRRNEHHNKQK